MIVFVATHYEKASAIRTYNRAFGDWAELFHDPVIVTATLDWRLDYSVVININGGDIIYLEYAG